MNISTYIDNGSWLPFTFAFLLGLSFLLYAVLDGYDLGVGMLSRWFGKDDRDRMIASIGPYWDANETWLVLGVGLLLVAFPAANGVVLGELYLPVTFMIICLVFRGVSFEFRKKVPPGRQARWDSAFFWSSLGVALSQGYMVGRFVLGFQSGLAAEAFAAAFGLLVVAGYVLMGASWLVLKTDGSLQARAIRIARVAIWVMVLGAILSSVSAAFADTRIYERMAEFPQVVLLAGLPLVSLALTLLMHFICGVLPLPGDRLAWMPFAISILIFVFGFAGLVYSFYPYIIPGRMLITEAAAAPESLMVMLVGTAIVLPLLLGYTALAYYIFRGKAKDLNYD